MAYNTEIELRAESALYNWYFDENDDNTVTFTIEDRVTITGERSDVAAFLEQMLEEVK